MVMKSPLFSRMWYYFRTGWSTYFALISGSVNTLTVTFYLAIEKVPSLGMIFPTFLIYVVIACSIGIPTLVFVGYLHFKRIGVFTAESRVNYEGNPFARRTLINSELTLDINLKLLNLLLNNQKNENLDPEKIKEIENLRKNLEDLVLKRQMDKKVDMKFMKDLNL